MDPRAFFERDLPEMLTLHSDGPLPPEVTVAFVIDGNEGGAWQVTSGPGGQCGVGPLGDGPADCHVRCGADQFSALLQGRVSAFRAFASGRIVIEGDVGLLLRLQDYLQQCAA